MTDTSKALEAVSRIFNYCEEIDNNIPEEERTGYNMLDDIDIIRRTLKELENQKTGHWIAQNIHNCHTDFKCSKCGYIHNFIHLYGEPTADYTYCPICGAKMN